MSINCAETGNQASTVLIYRSPNQLESALIVTIHGSLSLQCKLHRLWLNPYETFLCIVEEDYTKRVKDATCGMYTEEDGTFLPSLTAGVVGFFFITSLT